MSDEAAARVSCRHVAYFRLQTCKAERHKPDLWQWKSRQKLTKITRSGMYVSAILIWSSANASVFWLKLELKKGGGGYYIQCHIGEYFFPLLTCVKYFVLFSDILQWLPDMNANECTAWKFRCEIFATMCYDTDFVVHLSMFRHLPVLYFASNRPPEVTCWEFEPLLFYWSYQANVVKHVNISPFFCQSGLYLYFCDNNSIFLFNI